ncbi:hypothetical protein [Yersinia enterocolitica]|uniref:hypothetical protein n=1 Tax=Yersinia enterocolitica TaxID=630 RepID=UPI0005E30BFA|nr:tail fiber protein [Yersinia enterocolitica]
MHRIDTPSAQIDKFGVGKNGFTRGNPQTGVPATALDDDYFDAVQEELAGIVEAAGLELEKTDRAQVLAAIKLLIGSETNTKYLKVASNLAEIKAAGAAAVASTLENLGLTGIGIGLPNMSDIANFDWQNFVFTAGANYVTTYNTWVNPPDGITYNAGTRVSIRVIYISNIAAGPRMGLEITPDTSSAANFKVYKLLCVGAAGSRVFTFNQDWNSANPIPISGGGTGAITASAALANLGGIGLSQLTGVVGTSRNAKMSIPSASATATFTADELIVQTALGGLQYKLSSFSKTVNLATTGAGGMDTGTVPGTGYVALYAIYNPTSGASALLAVNATSVRAPEVYGGANMPAGYTASALVSAWRVASSQFVIGFQRGRHISIPLTQLWSTATGTTTITGVSLVPAAPVNAVSIDAYLTLYQTTTSVGVELSLYSSLSGIGQLRTNASVSGATSASISNGVLEVIDVQTLYFNMASTAAGSYGIATVGYSI